MTDPDATDTKWQRRYQAAELWFDDALALFTRSPWSLALFVAWTIALVAFGYWCGLKP